jgi:hypothetical protein
MFLYVCESLSLEIKWGPRITNYTLRHQCRSLNVINPIAFVSRDGILGHQFDKGRESFAPYYSQSLLLAYFTETILYSGFINLYKKNPRNNITRVYS